MGVCSAARVGEERGVTYPEIGAAGIEEEGKGFGRGADGDLD